MDTSNNPMLNFSAEDPGPSTSGAPTSDNPLMVSINTGPSADAADAADARGYTLVTDDEDDEDEDDEDDEDEEEDGEQLALSWH